MGTSNNWRCESIEDAGRVGDPTSLVRPCQNPRGVRSLVTVYQWSMCLEEELLFACPAGSPSGREHFVVLTRSVTPIF